MGSRPPDQLDEDRHKYGQPNAYVRSHLLTLREKTHINHRYGPKCGVSSQNTDWWSGEL